MIGLITLKQTANQTFSFMHDNKFVQVTVNYRDDMPYCTLAVNEVTLLTNQIILCNEKITQNWMGLSFDLIVADKQKNESCKEHPQLAKLSENYWFIVKDKA